MPRRRRSPRLRKHKRNTEQTKNNETNEIPKSFRLFRVSLLDLQNDRNDHRPASGLFLDIAFEIEPDFLLDHSPVDAFFVTRILDRLSHNCPGFLQENSSILAQCQTALDHFRYRLHLAR